MLAIERKNEILQKLKAEQRVLVSVLAEQYGVTEETIRRDLDKLEKEGYATKTYGGAIWGNSTKTDLSYTIRNRTNVEAKQTIGKLVAEVIEDGDHIMLDDSSTSLYIAKNIQNKRNLTVITNSVEILVELVGKEDWTVMSTGGKLKPESMALVGDTAQRMLRGFHVDLCFFSGKGLNFDDGITDSNEFHATMKKEMIASAGKVMLAIDSSKFDKVSFVKIASLSEIDTIITEKKPSAEWLRFLREKSIRCLYPQD
ncbi:MAG: DeoR/GlpR transcriptional regulator [Oscillospiraceae bacterium]|nr:DeoR/GlpR transcriptional regulator [Oscillospiraceae bacterium]MBR2896890.1 DeoR/GlpR transcriptional regulator [Oscillospiraceae bacterium]